MQGFIKVTKYSNSITPTTKITLRININGICHYEPIKYVNREVKGTRIHFLGRDDSIEVSEKPEEIDELIKEKG